jgi:hypothetical protein
MILGVMILQCLFNSPVGCSGCRFIFILSTTALLLLTSLFSLLNLALSETKLQLAPSQNPMPKPRLIVGLQRQNKWSLKLASIFDLYIVESKGGCLPVGFGEAGGVPGADGVVTEVRGARRSWFG